MKTTNEKNLSVHRSLVHNSTFYSCDECNTKTKTEDSLKKHKEKMHQISTAEDEEESMIDQSDYSFSDNDDVSSDMKKGQYTVKEWPNGIS